MFRAVSMACCFVLLMSGAVQRGAAQPVQPPAAAPALRWKVAMVGTTGGLLQWFPVYVARGEKFFEQEGIDLDWIDVNSGTAQAAAVMGGDAQLAPMGMEHMILSQKEGGDLMVVSALFNVYPHSLILSPAALKRSGIVPSMSVDEKIKRLKGLTIGVAGPGGSTDVMLRNLLTQRGMNPDRDIRIQPLGMPDSMLAAFSKGVTDGILQSAPVDAIAQARGYGTIVLDPFKEDIPELRNVPFSGLLATRSTIQQQPQMIAAAVRAIARAMQFEQDHPRQADAAVRQYVIAKGATPAVIDAMIERYRQGAATTPVVSAAQFAGTLRWVNLSEKTPVKVKMQDVVYNKAAQDAANVILKQPG